jgi:hypothetical protein
MARVRERFDDTFESAQNLGSLNGTRTIRGSLSWSRGSYDLDDFYKFQLGGRSRFSAALRGLAENAELQLLNSRGRAIAFSNKPGTRAESITRTLEAGTYFLQVSQYGVSTRYVLRTSVTPLVSAENPNPNPSVNPNPPGTAPSPNTPTNPFTSAPSSNPSAPVDANDVGGFPATGSDLGVLSQARNVRNSVGGRDTADFYRFTLNQSTQLSIAPNANVLTTLVFDINGNGFVDPGDAIASDDGSSNKGIIKSLGAGTYFVGISTESANTVNYELRLQPIAISGITPSADPAIGLGRASDLGTLTGARSIQQLVGSTDSTDIYKFTLNSVSNFTMLANSTQQTGDITISLIYDVDRNGIANPSRKYFNGAGGTVTTIGDFIGGSAVKAGASGAALGITKTLGPGTYYIAVTQKEMTDNSAYDLDVFVNNTITDLAPTANPGTAIANAFDIGTLNRDVRYKQFVGSVDGSDFYRFTLTQAQNFVISYNGSPEGVTLRLGEDRDNNGILNPTEDLNGNGLLDFEDKNRNNLVDNGEDENSNGILDTEDLNGNGRLDPNEVFEPEPTTIPEVEGRAFYSPLPPFYDENAKFVLMEGTGLINGFVTTVPTNIYAQLPAGTYVLQVQPNRIKVDLGDGLERLGSANVLYNIAFTLDS